MELIDFDELLELGGWEAVGGKKRLPIIAFFEMGSAVVPIPPSTGIQHQCRMGVTPVERRLS